MSGATLLAELRADGVVIRANGTNLRLLAPPGALTAADRQAITENKPALLAALAAEVEADRADVLMWGECYSWPSVRVAPLTADSDELTIPGGRAAWLAWTATAGVEDLDRVRMSTCYWQDDERAEWLAATAPDDLSVKILALARARAWRSIVVEGRFVAGGSQGEWRDFLATHAAADLEATLAALQQEETK